MVQATLRKKPGSAVADTSAAAVDENAAERLANEMGVGAGDSIPVEAEVVSETPAAPAPERPRQSVAVTLTPVAANNDSGITGDLDEKDFKVPQFKLVNGNGPLSKKYNVGSAIYADELLLKAPDMSEGAKNPTLNVVVVSLHKQFRENLTDEERAEEVQQRVVDSWAEAVELTGPENRNPDGTKRWKPSSRNVLLIEKPEGSKNSGFVLEADGKQYGPAVYYAAGAAFEEFFKTINSSTQIAGGHVSRFMWTLTIALKPWGAHTIWVPFARKVTPASVGPELRDLVQRFTKTRIQVEAED